MSHFVHIEHKVKMFHELLVGHLHPFVLHWIPLACFDSRISVERAPDGAAVQILLPGGHDELFEVAHCAGMSGCLFREDVLD
jgi:hypothetical protein